MVGDLFEVCGSSTGGPAGRGHEQFAKGGARAFDAARQHRLAVHEWLDEEMRVAKSSNIAIVECPSPSLTPLFAVFVPLLLVVQENDDHGDDRE